MKYKMVLLQISRLIQRLNCLCVPNSNGNVMTPAVLTFCSSVMGISTVLTAQTNFIVKVCRCQLHDTILLMHSWRCIIF